MFGPSLGPFRSTPPGRCPGRSMDNHVGGRASSPRVQLQERQAEHCTVQGATCIKQNGHTAFLEDERHVEHSTVPWLGAVWALSPSRVWEPASQAKPDAYTVSLLIQSRASPAPLLATPG